MFRGVILPKNVSGRLYLHSMPGRYEAWSHFIAEAGRYNVDFIVCLAPQDEIEKKSPSYANAVRHGELNFPMECFPVPDYEVPHDREEYAVFVRRIAELVRFGYTILVHCSAGIGRTGTFAICLLLALSLDRMGAEKAVCSAGSHPETNEQKEMVSWYKKKFHTAS